MLDNERLDFIMNELRVHKVASVAQLAQKCFVSPCTMRRDLDALEKKHLIHRAYGRAILAEHLNEEIPYMVRDNECDREKTIIASLAADMVRDGECVLLDGSSTAAHIIPYLRGKRRLSIVTNSAQTALDCQKSLSDVSVFCIGGLMNPNFLTCQGGMALTMLENFRPDIFFFSPRALSPVDGVGDVNDENVTSRRVMLRISRKKVCLTDSRKLSRKLHFVTCPLSELDYVVTEKRPSDVWIEAFENNGVELIYPSV